MINNRIIFDISDIIIEGVTVSVLCLVFFSLLHIFLVLTLYSFHLLELCLFNTCYVTDVEGLPSVVSWKILLWFIICVEISCWTNQSWRYHWLCLVFPCIWLLLLVLTTRILTLLHIHQCLHKINQFLKFILIYVVFAESDQIFQNLHQLPVVSFWRLDIFQGYFFV